TTLNDFFHLTDRPYETFRPEPDAYATPYLAQAVAKRDGTPVSRLARHHRWRARLEATRTIQGLARAIASASTGVTVEAGPDADLPAIEDVEERLETHSGDEVDRDLDRVLPASAGSLARLIVGSSGAGPSRATRPGYLVFNPLGVPRRAAIVLP